MGASLVPRNNRNVSDRDIRFPNSQGKIFDLVSTSPDRKTSFTGSMGWSIRDDINTCGYLQYIDASSKGYQCDPFSDLSKGNSIYGSSDTVQPAGLYAQFLIRYS